MFVLFYLIAIVHSSEFIYAKEQKTVFERYGNVKQIVYFSPMEKACLALLKVVRNTDKISFSRGFETNVSIIFGDLCQDLRGDVDLHAPSASFQ